MSLIALPTWAGYWACCPDYPGLVSPIEGLAGKIGIDATNKIGTETTREWGTVMTMRPEDTAFAETLLKRHFPRGVK